MIQQNIRAKSLTIWTNSNLYTKIIKYLQIFRYLLRSFCKTQGYFDYFQCFHSYNIYRRVRFLSNMFYKWKIKTKVDYEDNNPSWHTPDRWLCHRIRAWRLAAIRWLWRGTAWWSKDKWAASRGFDSWRFVKECFANHPLSWWPYW